MSPSTLVRGVTFLRTWSDSLRLASAGRGFRVFNPKWREFRDGTAAIVWASTTLADASFWWLRVGLWNFIARYVWLIENFRATHAIYVVTEVRHRGWGRYRQRGRYIQDRYIQWALYFRSAEYLPALAMKGSRQSLPELHERRWPGFLSNRTTLWYTGCLVRKVPAPQ